MNPLETVVHAVSRALKALQKPAITAVLLGLLLMYDPNTALAASGGRVGGRSFSPRSSYSSSRSYSTNQMASPSFSYSVPYYAPSPFGGVGFYGVGMGLGPLSSFIPLLMVGFAAYVLVSGFLSDGSEGSVLTATEKTSVLKLQVGLLGMGRSLQRDLNRIAQVAYTSTSEGLSYVLTGKTVCTSCIYFSSLFLPLFPEMFFPRELLILLKVVWLAGNKIFEDGLCCFSCSSLLRIQKLVNLVGMIMMRYGISL